MATAATTTITALPGSAEVDASAGTLTVPASTFGRGQKVTVTAAVPRQANKARATGTMTFTIDGGTPSTVALNSAGQALLSSTTYTLGTHTVSATYSGDARYPGGNVGSVTFDILKGGTTTTLTSLKTPILTKTRARINARTRVVAPARASVAGTTTFSADNGTDAPTTAHVATNNVGSALWQPLLADGTWTITATYDGNSDLASATSAPLTVTVGAPAESTIDQSNWGGDEVRFSYVMANTDTAQTFVAGRSGVLDRVDFNIRDEVGSASPLTVTIRTVDQSGMPTSTVLGSGTTTTAVAGSIDPDTVALTSPATVTAGTTYAIVLSSESNYGQWVTIASGDTYAGGQIYYASYGSYATYDLWFRTWVK